MIGRLPLPLEGGETVDPTLLSVTLKEVVGPATTMPSLYEPLTKLQPFSRMITREGYLILPCQWMKGVVLGMLLGMLGH